MSASSLLLSPSHPSPFFSLSLHQKQSIAAGLTQAPLQRAIYITRGERAKYSNASPTSDLHWTLAMNTVSPTFQPIRRRPASRKVPCATTATPLTDFKVRGRSPIDASKAMAGQATSPSKRSHFRPVDFQTKVELDHFFGQTKQQKRELALHMRDENGRWWFDAQGELN